MRLLEKREVAQKRSLEKRVEIEEGIKIARKVDALRDTAAKEEAKLSKFRSETVKQVTSEIESLTIDKAVLKNEVESLKVEKKTLREPLDAEWNRVKEEASKVESTKDELAALLADVDIKTKQLLRVEKNLRIEESRIAYEKQAVLKNFEDSQEALSKSKETLKEASDAKKSVLSFVKDKEYELSSREANIASLERNAQMRTKSQDAREVELNARETLINDRYQTLLRSTERLKK